VACHIRHCFPLGDDMDLKKNPIVVAAVILGVFIIAAILIYRYTSPVNQCLRDFNLTFSLKKWCYENAR
jgi:hypothetical protein